MLLPSSMAELHAMLGLPADWVPQDVRNGRPKA